MLYHKKSLLYAPEMATPALVFIVVLYCNWYCYHRLHRNRKKYIYMAAVAGKVKTPSSTARVCQLIDGVIAPAFDPPLHCAFMLPGVYRD